LRDGRRREAPLADINNREQLEAWLQTQPHEVSVALAARAALRVLPLVQEALSGGYKDIRIVLPVFRALAFSWVAAKYPAGASRFSAPPAGDLSVFGTARAASNAATAAFGVVRVITGSHSSIASVFPFAVDAIGSGRTATDGINFYSVSLPASTSDTVAFWSAVSDDATRVEKGVAAFDIAGSPLWQRERLHYQSGSQPMVELVKEPPDRLRSLWLELRAALVAANDKWGVWTDWYDQRLEGRVRNEERELAYVRVEETLWSQGPAVVNAEIIRLADLRLGVLAATEAPDIAAFTGTVGWPEPSSEPGPVLQVTERGLEIISQPIGTDFDETLQKALHDRLRHLLSTLRETTARVANAHPALDHLVSEYLDLIAQPFDQLDIASLWAVGTGLLAFRVAFANQPSGTMTEPLEPHHLALLQQAAEIHGGFILGFPKGRELTERADQTRLSPEIMAQIEPPARRILEELARAQNFVETRTRKFLAVIDESLIVHGWPTARIGHAAYVVTRNSLIAVGKYLLLANLACAAILGKPILPTLNLDAHTSQLIVEFLMNNAQDVLSFAEPFPDLRNWIGFLIDHIDQEK